MIKYISMTAQELMSKWISVDLMGQSERQKVENFIVSHHETNPLPLYMRVLIGIGALIGALFLGMFVWAFFHAFMKKGPFVHMILGLICIGSAILFDRRVNHARKTIKYYFFMQWFLCIMLVGKVLFVYGFSELMTSHYAVWTNGSWNIYPRIVFSWSAAAAILVITAITYPLYRVSIDRFLSVLAFCLVALYIVADASVFPIEIAWPIFLLLQILAIAFLFLCEKAQGAYQPIAYAVAFSLIIMVVFFALFGGGWFGIGLHNELFDQVFFVLSLMGLIIWIAGGFKKIKSEPVVTVLLGTVLLGILTFSSPGIIFSLCLLVLGYALYDMVFLIAGVMLLPFFISQYYYSLYYTLLVKSGLLMASGLVLLGGYAYMKFKKLDQVG